MKLQKSQKGVTLASIAFFLLLLGFVVYTVLKLFPVYMEAFTVESSVKGLEADKNQDYMGAMSVRQAVFRRFTMNNVSNVSSDDIIVARDNHMYMVDVNYEVRIPYFKNISLLLTFENHAEVPAR